jgi:hypothetical protein
MLHLLTIAIYIHLKGVGIQRTVVTGVPNSIAVTAGHGKGGKGVRRRPDTGGSQAATLKKLGRKSCALHLIPYT